MIARLVGQIDESQYEKPLEEGRFTPREVVAHLADWEPIMRDRIRQAVESPGSTIEAFDEGQMAIDHGYAKTDIHERARVFHQERSKTTHYVEGLTGDELKRAVTHPERGRQTAEDLVGMLLGHDMYHVEQLSGYLGG